jgi:hypothetical protein
MEWYVITPDGKRETFDRRAKAIEYAHNNAHTSIEVWWGKGHKIEPAFNAEREARGEQPEYL